jgi:hypothetical protein
MSTNREGIPGRPQAARLFEILVAMQATQAQVLAGLRSRREAVRRADFASLAALEKSDAANGARIAELERARAAECSQLAVRLALPPKASLAEISARLSESDRARLDLVRSELRSVLEEVQREGGVVRQATERLSAHMAGILQTVHSALAHAKVYSRQGVVALGPNVVSSLDIKS